MTLLTPGSGGASVRNNFDTGGYPLGFKPRFWLTANGKPLQTTLAGKGATATPVGYHAAISRVECSIGIDQINTLTITVVGEEAALLAKERFEKRMPVRLEVGYEDHPRTRQTIFDGHMLQGTPSGVNPVTVDIECDSLMYQAREDRGTAANTDANQAEFIAGRLGKQPTPITTNLEDTAADVDQDEGGQQEQNTSLIDFIQEWSQDNFIHWLDRMNGEVKFFYPGTKHDLYRAWGTWFVSARKLTPDDKRPAMLSEWSPRIAFVESPEIVMATYYLEDDNDLTPHPIESEPNPNGLEDTKVHIGPLYVKDQAAAKAIVDAAAADYYWHAIEGRFALSVGLPIMPLDDIVPTNGPAGLEDYYDRPFEVTQATHILDSRGWTVRGSIRGGRGA